MEALLATAAGHFSGVTHSLTATAPNIGDWYYDGATLNHTCFLIADMFTVTLIRNDTWMALRRGHGKY